MKKNSFSTSIIFLLVMGCVSAGNATSTSTIPSSPSGTLKPDLSSTSTATIQQVFTPTLTSTPQLPLIDHEWYPEPILISMRETMGDGGTSIGDVGTTWFVLYADGTLIVNNLLVVNDTYQYQYLTRKLNRQEICQHLNTFDQIGYLDYNASDYTFIDGKPYAAGGGSFLFQINAWKLKNDSYYDLGFYLRQDIINDLYGQKGYPIISPALQNTYYFLSQYPMTGLELYKPERLAVWIVPADYVRTDYEETAQNWELTAPTLRNLLQQSSNYIEGFEEKYIELKGSNAVAVYDYFGSMEAVRIFAQTMLDGNKQYFAVLVRPLLPFEKLNGDSMSDISPSSSEKPKIKLSCLASDRVLPIPIPANP